MALDLFEFEEKDNQFVSAESLLFFRILFKIVVLTLLMKMVIAIVIGGYEEMHEKQDQSETTSVPEDLSELFTGGIDWAQHEVKRISGTALTRTLTAEH